jgi:hypothetical protein
LKKRRPHPEFNFNPDDPNGESLRDEGIERVVGNTPEDYRENFRKAAKELISEGKLLTSEDITARCGMPPNHCHAVGGLMWGLVSSGLIEPVEDAKSKVPTSHAARLRLYRGKSRDDEQR